MILENRPQLSQNIMSELRASHPNLGTNINPI